MEIQELPKNIDAEKAVLGGVLINPKAYNIAGLEQDDFFLGRHRLLWEIFGDIIHDGDPLDFVTVTDRLLSVKMLDDIGGAAYLSELLNATASSVHVEDYAEIVKDKSMRRKALTIVGELAKSAYNQEHEFEVSRYVQMLSNIMHTKYGAVPIKEALAKLLDIVDERMKDPHTIYGIPTGYEDFDHATYGLHKKQGLMIAAPPGVGKSMWAMQMSVHLGEHGHPGVYYAMEMPDVSFASRAVSSITHLGTERYFQGLLEEHEYIQFLETIERLQRAQVFLSDRPSWTLHQLRADLTKLKYGKGVEWAVVDYLGLIANGGYKSEAEEINYKSDGLLSIARDLDIALVAIHTLTKEGQRTHRPSLTDMRGSGTDYGFDRVWFMVPEEQNRNLIHFVPGKARHERPPVMFTMIKSPNYPYFGTPAPFYLAQLEDTLSPDENDGREQTPMDWLHE